MLAHFEDDNPTHARRFESQNRYASYVALAFWGVGAIITGIFASNKVKINQESPSTSNATTAPGIEVTPANIGQPQP